MDDRFAPRAPAVVFVGAYAELVGGVGFQVVDDGFAGGAGLVDPLPVPLSVADGVEPNTREGAIKRDPRGPRTTEGVPQGPVLDPQVILSSRERDSVDEDVSTTILRASLTPCDSSGTPKDQPGQNQTGSSRSAFRLWATAAAVTSAWKLITIRRC